MSEAAQATLLPETAEALLKRFEPDLIKDHDAEGIERIKTGIEKIIVGSDDGGRSLDIYATDEIAGILQNVLPHTIDDLRVVYLVRDFTTPTK